MYESQQTAWAREARGETAMVTVVLLMLGATAIGAIGMALIPELSDYFGKKN